MADKFNLEYDIPRNKLVDIRDANGSIISQPLIFDEELSFKVNSKYSGLWESSPNNFLNLLSGSVEGIPSGQFALQGAQIWQSTDPIDISFKCSLEMDTDPYTDVVEPTIILMQTVVPKKQKEFASFGLGKIFKSELPIKIQTLIPPGPNIQTLLGLMANENSNWGKKLLSNGKDKGIYDVRIGFAYFYNVLIKSVDPSFSKTYAVSNNKAVLDADSGLGVRGNKMFPVRVDLNIEMTTMEIATTDMLDTIVDGRSF